MRLGPDHRDHRLETSMSFKQEDAPAYESLAPSHVEQLPSYSEYPTELPTTFPIGEKNIQPLVNVTELQAHLRLLGAFERLNKNVVEQRLPEGRHR